MNEPRATVLVIEDDPQITRFLATALDAHGYALHVADLDGEVVAYTVSFQTYSTFLARPTLFLEDLFVHPRARRQGVARALLDNLRARASELGCGRFEWMVLDWNTGAQTFYDGLGAERLDTWRLYRITV